MIVLGAARLGFVGGVERHVFDLASGLRARGHTVAFVHAGGEGRESERFARAFDAVEPIARAASLLRDARVIYLHKLDSPEALAAVPSGARFFFAAHDYDQTCVRSHRYLPLGAEPCSRAPGVACVTHGCVVVRRRGSLLGVGLRDPLALARRTRAIGERARMTACSGFVRRTLLDAGVPADRVTVVHPVPPDDATPLVPPPCEAMLGFVGQIIRGKGLDLLLRALVQLPEARLLVAGAGAGLDEERQRARDLGIAGRVEFLGAIPPERVREVYDRVRVLVVPSRWPEPFGMIGVEAMRRGRVTVGARHGGIPEWLDDGRTGVSFQPGDVDDLARAVRDALDATRSEERGRAAVARATGELSFGKMIDRVEQVLELV